MTIEEKIASFFKLTDQNWMRHANPWSVWTRYTVLPAIVLAFWSRAYLRMWSLIPIAASILWMFLNPVIFGRPKSTKNWASKSVLGERVWTNRDKVEIPKHHQTLPKILNGVSFAGTLLVIWGMITLTICPTVLGISLTYLGKSWFLDRMVWLYEDMKHLPEYKQWLY
ncbi:DUF6653 family protein [Atrimonas thermophila]|uniref:DUF6653 family protein n=1 Tax=Atrimonas thermophila TaxID=3064161 RepID=UPI00399C9AB3